MTDRDHFDIDGVGDVYTGDNWPFLPNAYRRRWRPLAMAGTGALVAIVAICLLVIISWGTGVMADELARVLP